MAEEVEAEAAVTTIAVGTRNLFSLFIFASPFINFRVVVENKEKKKAGKKKNWIELNSTQTYTYHLKK